MKKLLIAASVVLFVVALASCKGHEKCPAYSEVDSQSTEIPS